MKTSKRTFPIAQNAFGLAIMLVNLERLWASNSRIQTTNKKNT
jgi:hypothetical protein